MSPLQRRPHGILTQAAGGFAAILLLGLMVVTCLDVIGRYFFNAPLPGAFETTEVALALLIYAALPLVTAREEHVTIDLLDALVPERWRALQRLAVRAVCAAILLLVAWAVLRKADSVAAAGIHTDTLRIPMAPPAYFMSFIAAVTAVVVVILLIANWRESRRSRARRDEGGRR